MKITPEFISAIQLKFLSLQYNNKSVLKPIKARDFYGKNQDDKDSVCRVR